MQDWKMQHTTLYGTPHIASLCLLSFAGSERWVGLKELECDRYRSVVNQIARLAIVQVQKACCWRGTSAAPDLRRRLPYSGTSAQEVAFAEVESSMYKRRRTAMPSLPRNPQSSDHAVSVSRFASLGRSSFNRGQVTDGNNDTALMFATDGQLELLRLSCSLIFIDSTFRVVPRLYYTSCSPSSCRTSTTRFPFSTLWWRAKRQSCTKRLLGNSTN